MKKEMIIRWDENMYIEFLAPIGNTKIVELLGVLEMCKLTLFKNRNKEESK